MRLLIILLLLSCLTCFGQHSSQYLTPYEKGNGNQTATYEELITFYKKLDTSFETIKMIEMGLTDSGEPLHMVIYDGTKSFDLQKTSQTKVLINNSIHPGEPDGNDASLMYIRDLATSKIIVPKNTLVVVIPAYNIGGTLNRNSFSRANQNGPEAYGFRGNARNYDLNRDFVKSDTRNARSFAQLFHQVQPEVFIDNHVSNGADYQYVFTYIQTQHQKLGTGLGDFLQEEMTPALMKELKKKKIESVPYVTVYGATPEKGFSQMMDLPRYSTGYASLFGTIGYMPETHMLKIYSERVRVTYEFMLATVAFVDQNSTKIKSLHKENWKQFAPKKMYPLQWKIDSTKVKQLSFLGYEHGYKKSAVSGQDRLYYDAKKPFQKEVPYYNFYKPTKEVMIPKAYVIPKSWWTVIELLQLNNIALKTFSKDTLITVEKYHIDTYKTSATAYEGHYNHSNTTVKVSESQILFRKGDFYIPTQQLGVKYLLETLEPEAPDSFFNWNFFDAILHQKEGYSAYVFEDLAADLLEKDAKLKATFEAKKAAEPDFSANGKAQLDWIYKNSAYYEPSHNVYPVYRIMD
jgi:Zinc carboxypeptidase